MTSQGSERSSAPLTDAHLARLTELADEDHLKFCRPSGRPEYRDRRVAVVLAQGGAQHYIDGVNGVKDLDVWTFYAEIPGTVFPGARRKLHVDFGPSEHGRNLYPPDLKHPQLPKWKAFTGRRVDLMMRSLKVRPEVSEDALVHALRDWLESGAAESSPWWLAHKAVVMIAPRQLLGSVVWPI